MLLMESHWGSVGRPNTPQLGSGLKKGWLWTLSLCAINVLSKHTLASRPNSPRFVEASHVGALGTGGTLRDRSLFPGRYIQMEGLLQGVYLPSMGPAPGT